MEFHSGKSFAAINSVTNESLVNVTMADETGTKRAIDVVHRTSTSGVWSELLVEERFIILRRISNLIFENIEELAYIKMLDV